VALYRSEADGSYQRISNGILLSKRPPSDPLSPDPERDILLNFNCNTHVLSSTMRVQEGDIFGALIVTDRVLSLPLGGLDLVGDSSNGYLMMNKSLDQGGRDLINDIFHNTDGLDLPTTLNGLTMDTEKRVLHVYANISKPKNLAGACLHINPFNFIHSSRI
jgi:hypothetical protein